jgi:hypothetical protein
LAKVWSQRLERAAYEADRAARQYRLVEPENRLVARQLEREWEEKLVAQQGLQDERRRFEQAQPRILSAAEQAAIRRLATDIPALWSAPTTTDADRKEIIRQVVERVVVDGTGGDERIMARIEWVGGAQTVGDLTRPVGRWDQLSFYADLAERVRSLAAAGLSYAVIAERLNTEGFHPPKWHKQFRAQEVSGFLRSDRRRARQG